MCRCVSCGGSGGEWQSGGGLFTCKACEGDGVMPCERCGGDGMLTPPATGA